MNPDAIKGYPTVLGTDPDLEQYCIELKNQFLSRGEGLCLIRIKGIYNLACSRAQWRLTS